jgi:hypothetical protein
MAVTDGTGIGLSVQEPESSLVAEDVVVRDIGVGQGRGGQGVVAADGASLQLTRAAVFRALEFGVGALLRSTVVAKDVTVVAAAAPDSALRLGMTVDRGANMNIERAELVGPHGVSIFVTDAGTELVAGDVRIDGGENVEVPGVFGQAVAGQRGAAIRAERIAIANVSTFGIVVSGSESEGAFNDVEVNGVRALSCMGAPCGPLPSFGSAAMAFRGALLGLARFTLVDGDQCGIYVDEDAQVELADGLVARHPVGLCVTELPDDLAALAPNVRFEENQSNLDAMTLPTPAAVDFRF